MFIWWILGAIALVVALAILYGVVSGWGGAAQDGFTPFCPNLVPILQALQGAGHGSVRAEFGQRRGVWTLQVPGGQIQQPGITGVGITGTTAPTAGRVGPVTGTPNPPVLRQTAAGAAITAEDPGIDDARNAWAAQVDVQYRSGANVAALRAAAWVDGPAIPQNGMVTIGVFGPRTIVEVRVQYPGQAWSSAARTTAA